MLPEGSIGVFDSGFGGLDILHGIVKALPQYDYIYLGDSNRAPYGNRSEADIFRFTQQAVEFLFSQNCPLIILACNTASAQALSLIQHQVLPLSFPDRRVLGVIIPAVEAVAEAKCSRVGVIATPSTADANAFARELAKLNPNIKVFQQACPKLVPLIESDQHRSKKIIRLLRIYLTPLLEKNIDSLILGCTHYGLIADQIQTIVGEKIRLLNEADLVPGKLAGYLLRHPQIEKKLTKNKRIVFFSTKPSPKFDHLGSQFFGSTISTRLAKLSI